MILFEINFFFFLDYEILFFKKEENEFVIYTQVIDNRLFHIVKNTIVTRVKKFVR